MDIKHSNNPRSIRAREALIAALKDMLKEKPFAKISITDIARRAGLARHTFYNHYQTKEELLTALVDSIVIHFVPKEVVFGDSGSRSESFKDLGVGFFQTWKDNAEVLTLLSSVNIEPLLISRFQTHLNEFYLQENLEEITGVSIELHKYTNCIHSHAFVGVLMQWIRDGMKYPPEVMGDLVDHFVGAPKILAAAEKFKGVIA